MSRPASGRLAGLLVLPLLVLGPLSLLHVPGLVHVPGDGPATAAALAAHAGLFRLALLAVLVSRSGRVPRLFAPMLAVAAGGCALNGLALVAAPSLVGLTTTASA